MEWGRMQAMRDAMEQPQRWVAGLCLLVVLALIGTESAGIATTLRAPAPTLSPAATSAASDFVGRVTNANLFGSAPVTTANDQSLPQTQLQVTLRGVFTADDPALASAIIETEDGRMQIVKAGASVGGETVLQRVYANRVVLARAGMLENLYFPTSSTTEIATPVTTAPVQSAPTAEPADDSEEGRKANILRRLEELRARGALSQ